MPASFTIRTEASKANERPGMKELFQVAIDDKKLAIEAVRRFTKAGSDTIIEVAGELSYADLKRLRLEGGEVMSIGKTKREM
jgi:hypothetical protein